MHLAVGSRDLSQAEKKVTSNKSEQIQKKDKYLQSKWSFRMKIVVIFKTCLVLATVFCILACDKSREQIANCLNKCRPPNSYLHN